MTTRDWVALIALGAVWGFSFYFVELALEGFGPLTVVTLRIGIAALFLNIVYIALRKSYRALFRKWRYFCVVGLFSMALPFATFPWGQQYIDSGLAAVLNALTPLVTMFLAVVVRQEKVSIVRIIALLIGLVGVVLLLGPSFRIGGLALAGTLVIALAPLCYAIGSVFVRGITVKINPLEIATGALTIGTLYLLPFTLALEQPWIISDGSPAPSLVPWLGILGLAIPGAAISFVVFFSLINRVGATNAVTVTLIMPVVGVLVGVFLLGEEAGAELITGMVLILSALVIMDPRFSKLLKRIWRRLGRGPKDSKPAL